MISVVPGLHQVRFDAFELDIESGELRKHGARLTLAEQPLQLLMALLEQSGKVVTRDELRQRLWPSDTFVDFEHGLNAAIKRLRDTLGDSADAPRFIETVPRRGYRFIAHVESIGELAGGQPLSVGPAEIAGAQPRQTADPLSGPQRRARLWPVAGALAIITLSLVGFLIVRSLRSSTTPASPPMHLVAATTMEGFEAGGLSPDGRQLAFEWNGEAMDNRDIYVKFVASPDTHRLTTDPATDIAPQWSRSNRA